MTRLSKLARFGAAVLVFAAVSQTALAQNAPPPGIPNPRILLVDRAEVLSRSNVGASIMNQVRGLVSSAQNGLKAREIALQKEGQALQQQIAILAPSVKDAKVKAFRAKQEALQLDVQRQQSLIQGGLLAARTQALNALKPILQRLLIERGANILIDRNAVLEWLPAFDVTGLAIQRLNAANLTITVKPTPLPQNAAPQQ